MWVSAAPEAAPCGTCTQLRPPNRQRHPALATRLVDARVHDSDGHTTLGMIDSGPASRPGCRDQHGNCSRAASAMPSGNCRTTLPPMMPGRGSLGRRASHAWQDRERLRRLQQCGEGRSQGRGRALSAHVADQGLMGGSKNWSEAIRQVPRYCGRRHDFCQLLVAAAAQQPRSGVSSSLRGTVARRSVSAPSGRSATPRFSVRAFDVRSLRPFARIPPVGARHDAFETMASKVHRNGRESIGGEPRDLTPATPALLSPRTMPLLRQRPRPRRVAHRPAWHPGR